MKFIDKLTRKKNNIDLYTYNIYTWIIYIYIYILEWRNNPEYVREIRKPIIIRL